MRHRPFWLIAAVVLVGLWAWTQASRDGAPPGTTASMPSSRSAASLPASLPTTPAPARTSSRYPALLPREAHAVLDAIARGGPYAHRQDGAVFQNREHRLPAQPRGYYREYTVPSPGSGDRGPRRIITGGATGGAPREYWYSDDHYRSFRRFDPVAGGAR